MKNVSPEALSYCKNFFFTFSNTRRNESVNLNSYASATFIIDVDGRIYQGAEAKEDAASVILIGGTKKFINEKALTVPSYYYITQQQKITLYKAMKLLSTFTHSAQIQSDNEQLQRSISALYLNFCG
jgi:hypothetical protein